MCHLAENAVIGIVVQAGRAFTDNPDCFEANPERGISEKNQCLEIYSALTDLYKEKPGSLVNYVDSPKENGYQAIHCKVMCSSGQWLEVHIASEGWTIIRRWGVLLREKGWNTGLKHSKPSFMI